MDMETVLWWLRTLGETVAIQMTVFLLYLIWSGRLVAGGRLEDLKEAVEEAARRTEEWRELALRVLKHDPEPRKLECGEDELGWDCRDTYDHAFCSHDCCADKDFCRAPEVDGARGYYKDVVGRDPTPPEGFWAWLWWTRPTALEAAKWNWDHKQADIVAMKLRMVEVAALHEKVVDLRGQLAAQRETVTTANGWVIDVSTHDSPAASPPSRDIGQGAVRPTRRWDEDDGQRQPGPGPSRR